MVAIAIGAHSSKTALQDSFPDAEFSPPHEVTNEALEPVGMQAARSPDGRSTEARCTLDRCRVNCLFMSNDRLFVGRKDELRRFREEVLEKPDGQAVVVIGAEAVGTFRWRAEWERHTP